MKRSSLDRPKHGSLTRRQARTAVLGVKAARVGSGAKKPGSRSTAKKASTSVVERYLGHFGVGAASVAKRTGGKKSGAKKSPAVSKAVTKKASVGKSYRRAS